MRSLKFHFVRAKNILCFGPQGIELHFSDYGNIVQIKGINLDMPGTDDHPASNATGKSSLQELFSIALFGRTVKSPTKNKAAQILNVLADKGEVELQWDDYRLIRSYSRTASGASSKLKVWKSPNRIWDNDSLLDLTTPKYEEEIAQSIGLSHHAFCNVVIFDDSSHYSFLEADGPTKRMIVENLLDLGQYQEYHKNAKEIVKNLKEQIRTLGNDYSRLVDVVDDCERRIVSIKQQEKAWHASKKQELNNIEAALKQKQNQLENLNEATALNEWNKAQDRIQAINVEIIELQAKSSKIQQTLQLAQEKLSEARNESQKLSAESHEKNLLLSNAQNELNKAIKLVNSLEKLEPGTPCPVCHATINQLNYHDVLVHSRATISESEASIEVIKKKLAESNEKLIQKNTNTSLIYDKIKEVQARIPAFDKKILGLQQELNNLNKLGKPDVTATSAALEMAIAELRKQKESKELEANGFSPYKEILEQAELEKIAKIQEKDLKSDELKAAELDVPYTEYWVKAFGDDGIRKNVIDGIIPALNDRIAYWLEILCEGIVQLTFDNTLEETIIRNNNPATYYNASNGEKRRINLAVSQAFAHIMMLHSGTCPSIVFLDEVTSGAIDHAGIPGIHNMIFELAKERQVFVTTHNEILMALMQGCETITLKKEHDITVLDS